MNIGGFFKALQIMGIISAWSTKALADGKVTLAEATELASEVCNVLGVPLEIDVSDKE